MIILSKSAEFSAVTISIERNNKIISYKKTSLDKGSLEFPAVVFLLQAGLKPFPAESYAVPCLFNADLF